MYLRVLVKTKTKFYVAIIFRFCVVYKLEMQTIGIGTYI